ncbi:AraC family transcriptional regulator [Rubellicoccus peritrichatus]|uniref:AraC family transcriptional regulator n=1 Tax=Rubellicoccus peritrichatus TaxID=3080537 RepID=A0AAQ3LK10_9BACT|nr:AraC family transcriptional regulator [Puniceicoccus sp. CR14]WOO43669.1 AraC family transcriptional regulator [Puniceicoccus sp. CR14]
MSQPVKLHWNKLAHSGEITRTFRDIIHEKSPGGYHYHDFHEVFRVEKGRGIHQINGQFHPLTEGQICFIRASDTHAFRGTSADGLTLLNISMHPDLSPPKILQDPMAGKPKPLPELFNEEIEMPPIWHPPAKIMPEVSHVFRHFINGYRDSLALRLFIHGLADLYRAGDKQITDIAPEWLSDAFLCLEFSANLQIGVQAVVQSSGRSLQHLNKECKRYFGKTLGDIVSARRLQLAVRLLELEKANISEIAQECGYASVSHFVRKFKAAYGQPPLRWRKHRSVIVRG